MEPSGGTTRRLAATLPMRALALLLRLGLGALFGVAGLLKLRDVSGFAVEIGNYRLLPSLAPYLAVTLPGIEIALGAALVAGTRAWQRAGALLAAATLAVFTAALTQVMLRGINVQCGCFGGETGPVTWLTVLRDVGLLAAAAAVWFLAAPEPAPVAGDGARGA